MPVVVIRLHFHAVAFVVCSVIFSRFLFMALEGEGGQKSASSAGKPKSRGGGDGSGDVGDGDGDGDKQGGLSDTVKDLFAGRLMNYIEVRT